jgi:hypothetical protein
MTKWGVLGMTKLDKIMVLGRFSRKTITKKNTAEGRKGGKTEFTSIVITYCIL